MKKKNKYLSLIALLCIPMQVMYTSCAAKPAISEKPAQKTEIKLKEYPELVACYNQNTWKFAKPADKTNKWCWIGKDWSNVYLPSQSQYDMLTRHFGSNIYSKMAIINHESQWNSKTVGVHKYWKDCGLVQIRDIYGWCKMTDDEQMEWMKDKIERSKKAKICKQYTGEKLIRCVFMKHNGQVRINTAYDNKLIRLMNWYQENFK